MRPELKKPLGPPAEILQEYPDLAQYPRAMEYLASLGIGSADLAAVYPKFEAYGESEFDTKGHAFTYSHIAENNTRLDRVLFPSDNYPFFLAVERQNWYRPPRKGIGIHMLPLQRVRLDVYPDQSVFLQLQRATLAHTTDMATYYVDSMGQVSITDLAVMNDKHLYTRRGYAENVYPAELSALSDEEAERIVTFSQDFLEQGWELTLGDIALPSAELTRRIISAPVEKGVNLKEMLGEKT